MSKSEANKLIPNPETGGYSVYIPDSSFDPRDFHDPEHPDGDRDPKPVDELFPKNQKPSYTDVRQSDDKACFFLSTIAEIAQHNPDYVSKMITDNKEDNTVTVHFYAIDPKTKKKVPYDVTVDRTKTLLDPDSEPWANLMEKAYAASMLYSNMGEIPEQEKLPHIDEKTGQLVNTVYITELGNGFEAPGHVIALDGGSQPGVLQVLFPGSGNQPRIEESREKSSLLTDAENIQQAEEILGNAMLENFKNNSYMFFTAMYHTMPVVDVKKEEGKGVQFCVYDQTNRQNYWVSLREVCANDMPYKEGKLPYNEIFDGISIMQTKNGEPEGVYDTFSVADLSKNIDNAHAALKKDDFEKICHKKLAGMLDINNMLVKNEKQDMTQDGCLRNIVEKTMKEALTAEFNRLEEYIPKPTPAKLRAELNKPDSEAMRHLKENFLNAVKNDPTYVDAALQERITQKLIQEPKKSKTPKEKSQPSQAEKTPARKKTVYVRDASSMAKGNASLVNFASSLNKAQTTFGNSDEYKRIIKGLERMTAGQVPKDLTEKGLDAKQIYAAQLVSMQGRIEKYLEHKAIDGVKANITKKLETVEYLSREISQTLQELDFKPFTVGKINISKDTLEKKDYSSQYDSFAKTADKKEINLLPEPQKGAEQSPLDACMSKIMLKTVQKKPKNWAKKVENCDKIRQKMVKNAAPTSLLPPSRSSSGGISL